MKTDKRNVASCLTAPTVNCISGGTPTPDCSDPVFAAAHPELCGNPTIPDCSDPAYAAANPEICGVSVPVLILKPKNISLCLMEGVQMKTFLYNQGLEVEITSGLTYQSSNQGVALIGASSGKVSGASAGIANISVTWQGKSAFSQATVLPDCCNDEKVGIVLLIDNSKSMGLTYGAPYGTKLSYAKEAARRFASDVNYNKDMVGVIDFSSAATTIQNLTQVELNVISAIGNSNQSQLKTELWSGLNAAVDMLNAEPTLTRRVVLLITDGESSVSPDPFKALADSFTAITGNVLMILGVRASGWAYDLLERTASGGFFVNSYGNNGATNIDILRGLKGYICAGNCVAAGNVTVPLGALDYTGFVNWDVSPGKVDLIGEVVAGYGIFDIMPGNGLYVDLCGSSAQFLGTMTTKKPKSPNVVNGGNYELTFFLAGNQREDIAGHVVTVSVLGDGISGDLVLAEQQFTIDDWKMPFTVQTIDFNSTVTSPARIRIATSANPGTQFYGLLLDSVQMTNTDTKAVLFFDNFDAENETFIPPACVTGSYGNECYGMGCLTAPPGPQLPDPNPAASVEVFNSSRPPFVVIEPDIFVLGDAGLVLGDGGMVLGDAGLFG